MKIVLEEIGNTRLAQALLKLVDPRKPINQWLTKHPLLRHSKSGRSHWQIDDLSSYWVSQEVFQRGEYDPAITAGPVRTFIDLGTNVGYFSCRIAEFHPAADVHGLCLEANPNLLPKIARNLSLNGLSGVTVVNGLAGAPPTADGTEAKIKFHVSPAHSCSSASGLMRPEMSEKAEGTIVEVSPYDITALWKEHLGGHPIDLLKVDIEGCEENLVFNEPELFAGSTRVVMEVHHWLVDTKKVHAQMEAYGFLPARRLFESKWWDLLYWERRQS